MTRPSSDCCFRSRPWASRASRAGRQATVGAPIDQHRSSPALAREAAGRAKVTAGAPSIIRSLAVAVDGSTRDAADGGCHGQHQHDGQEDELSGRLLCYQLPVATAPPLQLSPARKAGSTPMMGRAQRMVEALQSKLCQKGARQDRSVLRVLAITSTASKSPMLARFQHPPTTLITGRPAVPRSDPRQPCTLCTSWAPPTISMTQGSTGRAILVTSIECPPLASMTSLPGRYAPHPLFSSLVLSPARKAGSEPRDRKALEAEASRRTGLAPPVT